MRPLRIAVFGDVHGNLPALEAVLDDASAWQADEYVCMGDIAFKGPQPSEAVARLRSHNPCITIVGNTDRWISAGLPKDIPPDPERRRQFEAFRTFALEQLTHEHVAWLASLPYDHTRRVGEATFHFVHASPHSLEAWFDARSPDAELQPLIEEAPPDVDVLVYGHIHTPFIRRIAGRTLINTGSTGNPVDGDPRAAYLRIEASNGAVALSVRRVPYSIASAVECARQKRFPSCDAYAAALREAKAL